MADFTLEQQQAIAIAEAKMKMAQAKPEQGNLYTQGEVQYSPEGIPLATSSYGSANPYQKTEKALTTAVSLPISYAAGVAKPIAGVSQALSKLMGSNVGDVPVQAINTLESGMEQSSAAPLLNKAATIAGETTPFVPLGNKVIGQIPSFSRLVGGGAALGAISGLATPEKTGLTPEEFANAKMSNVETQTGIGAAIPVVGKTIQGMGALLRKGAGISTGAGEEALKQAYKAGQIGDDVFLANMKGEVSNIDVLTQAKQALANMRANRSAEYKAGIETTKKAPIFYKFDPIENKLKDELKTLTVKNLGKELPLVGEAEMTKVNELKDIVGQWKANPELWTAEGLDALKRRLDAIYPEKLPQAARVIQGVRDKVYNHIVELDPNYAKTMKAYEEAITLEREIEKTLSLGKKASADTAIRKLQSLTRNNVNTSYGYRQELAQALKEQGGKDLMPALAGQALSSYTPRGIVGQGADVGAILATLANPAAALSFAPMAAYTSPRLMGMTAYQAGKLSNKTMSPEAKNLARLLTIKAGATNE